MHAGNLAEIDYLRTLARRLNNAQHGERGQLLTQAEQTLGISRKRVYARLATVGWSSGRKLRADCGASAVTDEEVRAVASVIRASNRQTGKQLLTISDAIEMALANDLLRNRVSPSRMSTLMRRCGCHPEQLNAPAPHTELRSLHPNHVWQFDASLCVLYYAPQARGLCVMEESEFYAKKPAKLESVRTERLLRYMVTDHCSGSMHVRYYAAQGEDQGTLVEFLIDAFTLRDGHVMHGVPWQLVWDAGSANTSAGVQAMLEALAVQAWTHLPGNARAKGQVEGGHNIFERRFEGRLAFMRIESLEHLNSELDVWLQAFNGAQVHSRHKHTRWGLWQTIRTEQLRICPPADVCRALVTSRPEDRKVDGRLCIRFAVPGYGSQTYSVQHVPDVRVGETVRVIVNPYQAPDVFVLHQPLEGPAQPILCTAIERDDYGFDRSAPVIGDRFAAIADTRSETERKAADNAAWGQTDDRQIKRNRKRGAVAFGGDIDAMADVRKAAANVPAHMPRRGTTIDVPQTAQVEARPLSHTDALLWLRDRLNRAITAAESERVRTWYPEGVPEDELENLVARINRSGMTLVGVA